MGQAPSKLWRLSAEGICAGRHFQSQRRWSGWRSTGGRTAPLAAGICGACARCGVVSSLPPQVILQFDTIGLEQD